MKPIKKVILIVDDDEILRETIAYTFRKRDYEVKMAAGGREALAIVQSEAIEVVLSDVQMPDGNGVELLKAVREIHPQKPIFFLMSGFTEYSVKKARDDGAYDLIQKPFDQKKLVQDVDRASDEARIENDK